MNETMFTAWLESIIDRTDIIQTGTIWNDPISRIEVTDIYNDQKIVYDPDPQCRGYCKIVGSLYIYRADESEYKHEFERTYYD